MRNGIRRGGRDCQARRSPKRVAELVTHLIQLDFNGGFIDPGQRIVRHPPGDGLKMRDIDIIAQRVRDMPNGASCLTRQIHWRGFSTKALQSAKFLHGQYTFLGFPCEVIPKASLHLLPGSLRDSSTAE